MNAIGMSLPFRYLSGQSPTVLDTLLGPAQTGLPILKKRGVDSIEIRAAGASADPQLVLLAAQRVWDAGLDLTIHGGLPEFPVQSPFEVCYPAFNHVTGLLQQKGKVAAVALHAYADMVTPPEQHATQTVAALKSLAAMCDHEKLPYCFALELNRSKGEMDPSTTYESVLDMLDQARHPSLGLCWDFGHGFSNFSNGLIPRDPPELFLKSVIHTHIHDLAPHGKTHWPLTERKLPLQAYVDLLKSADYQGVWNMELDPARYENEPNLAQRILQSIDLLRQAVGV